MGDKELEQLLAKRDEIDRLVANRQRNLAVLFTDICGCTELFEKRGDVEGVAFIHRHNRLLFPLVEEHGGQIVKTIGDAIMAIFEDPAAAVRCAATMQIRLHEARGESPQETPIHIKVGVHFGKVVPDGKDVFGDAVNTAARVQGKAIKDEVLVSATLFDLVAESCGFEALPRGAVSLKGKAEPLPVVTVRWGQGAPSAEEIARQAEETEAFAGGKEREAVTAPPELFVLEIARTSEGLKVAAIDGPEDKGPVKSYAEVPLSAAGLESVASRMAAFLGGNASSYAERLADEGKGLFEMALSERVKKRLEDTPRRFLLLQVDDSLAHVPWELMHDGKSHLCLRFAVGRVVAAREQSTSGSATGDGARALHTVVVANPTGDLPEAAREGEAVAGLLEEGFGGKVLHLRGPCDRQTFLESLEGARILHFAGHLGHKEGMASCGFHFCDGVVTPDEVAARLGRSSTDLVFANACSANEASGWSDVARGTFDVASTLLLRGVRHYLGPIGRIGDSDALAFALRFYEEILGGACFGEAARRARESLAQKSAAPSFARYLLYGEPTTTLPRDLAVLPDAGPTRAASFMTPGDGVGDGVPVLSPANAGGLGPSPHGRDGPPIQTDPGPPKWLSPIARGGRTRVALAAVAGLGVIAGALVGANVWLESREEAVAHQAATISPDEPKQRLSRTGDIRMTVMEIRAMAGNPDPHLTGRLTNTLNFALVGVPGFIVTDRADFDQFVGLEESGGELRKQAEMTIFEKKGFDDAHAAEIGLLRGVEVAIVGGFQEAAGRIQIVANFVDVETSLVLEAVRVDGPAGEEHVFDIQEELSREVLAALPRVREKLRPAQGETPDK